MSEFCYDCTDKYEQMPPDQNGLRHDSKNELLFDVCEGCGEGYFNWQGQREDSFPSQLVLVSLEGKGRRITT